jgi:hypothetical protein
LRPFISPVCVDGASKAGSQSHCIYRRREPEIEIGGWPPGNNLYPDLYRQVEATNRAPRYAGCINTQNELNT